MSNVFHYDSVKAEQVDMEGASRVKMRWLITKEMGAGNFAMRVFEVEPSGFSPLHKHLWEHEVFILEGSGELFNGEKAIPLKAGDVVFVPPNEMHQFRSNSATPLRFLCLIPYLKE
ncbi:MAG: cupin domain-containing protein [Candidatus Bathyarchaeota archaeon]|nr:cupin domain-containing protein [Candidatus Bathyarchaeota archaeon]